MKIRLLVVEDADFQRKVILDVLRKNGYEALGTSTGWEALELARSGEDITVVVTDYEMPEMNGIELFKKFQEEFGRKMPDFILCSASQDKNAMEEAQKLGFRDVVVKAPGFERLLEALGMMERVYEAHPDR